MSSQTRLRAALLLLRRFGRGEHAPELLSLQPKIMLRHERECVAKSSTCTYETHIGIQDPKVTDRLDQSAVHAFRPVKRRLTAYLALAEAVSRPVPSAAAATLASIAAPVCDSIWIYLATHYLGPRQATGRTVGRSKGLLEL